MSGAVAGVLLAAGAASRMGHPKQLATVGGRALVVRAVDALAPVVDRLLVVVGAHEGAVRDVLGRVEGRRSLEIVVNTAWREGMGTSVAAGVARAIALGADVAVVTACDQPDVQSRHLAALLDALVSAPEAAAAAASYDGVVGVPAAFRVRRCGHELVRLDGARGARAVLRAGEFQVVEVAMPAAAHDIDTPDDLAEANDGHERRTGRAVPNAAEETRR